MKNYKLLPKIALLVLIALGLVFIAMFFFGGVNGTREVAGDILDVPRFTDAFLFWNYILLGLVILVTLCVVCVEFAKNLKHNRRKAFATLGVVIGFIVLACVCWFIGSPSEASSVMKDPTTWDSGLNCPTRLSMHAISSSPLLL